MHKPNWEGHGHERINSLYTTFLASRSADMGPEPIITGSYAVHHVPPPLPSIVIVVGLYIYIEQPDLLSSDLP